MEDKSITTQPNELTVGEAWGASEMIDAKDIQISRISQQQALSKLVEAGKANPGDWCDSLSGEVLAKKDETLKVIIFNANKKLLIHKGFPGEKLEYVESQDVTEENVNLPWSQDLPNGEVLQRHMQYNYFCLLEGKVNDIPYILSFTSSKIKTAKKLNSMLIKLKSQNRPSPAVVFELKSTRETGDKGSWFGVDVQVGRDTTFEELSVAKERYMQSRSTSVRVSQDDDIVF